jgi:uncharacterized DUF497 family protein
MSSAPNRPRNTRTANGLKKGMHMEWDTPKPKPQPKKKTDPIEILDRMIQDKEVYSVAERKNFSELRRILLNMQEEMEVLRDKVFGM